MIFVVSEPPQYIVALLAGAKIGEMVRMSQQIPNDQNYRSGRLS